MVRAFAMSLALAAVACVAGPSSTASSLPSGSREPKLQGMHPSHRFDDAERWAKVFDAPEREGWQKPDEVVTLCAIKPGMTVVDVGAGTGYFLARLSKAVGDAGRVIATDIEPEMVDYMKERATREALPNVAPLLVPADDPGVPLGTVDRFLLVDVWHHLGDRRAYAARLGKGLKEGGMIIVVDFTLEASHGPPKEHRLRAEEIVADLAAAGLVAKVVYETLPDQYVVVAKAR